MSRAYEHVLLSTEKGVATVTLNRPQVLNALSPQLIEELTQVLTSVSTDESVRSVIITGAGRGFCSGGDIKLDVSQVRSMPVSGYQEFAGAFMAVIVMIYEMAKPVIAAVNGIAFAGGLDLALACDIRIASEEARLGCSYIKMALPPEMGSQFFLSRLVGLGRAKLLAFTGDLISAMEAERIGLVDRVVTSSELAAAANDLAGQLAQGPTKSIGLTKRSIHDCLNLSLTSSLEYAKSETPALLQTEDFKEAYTAFLEKRKPVFHGR